MDGVSTGIAFELPPAWHRWDPDDPVGASAADLDARIGERRGLAPVRQTVLRLLIGFWHDAAAQQAVAAAALVEPASDAAVVATLVVVEAGREHPGDDAAEIAALVNLLEGASPVDIRPRTIETVKL